MAPLSIIWDIDPTFFSIGDFEVRYYGLCWVVAFMAAMAVFTRMLRHEGRDEKLVDSAFIYCFIATIVGARLGHCLFYEPEYFLLNPFEILNIRGGGLASHGAAFGLLLGLYLFAKKNRLTYIWSLDHITATIPLAGAFVRLGNLLNSEIYGTETTMPWGFIFAQNGETVPMHPTQIYEIIAYLITFAVLMYAFYKKDAASRPGVMFALFLIMLFGSRFIIESIKAPQVAFEQSMALNMGQILSIPFVIGGVILLIFSVKRGIKAKKS